jgi:phenylacetate-CoA oxygenase PaaJ subunit
MNTLPVPSHDMVWSWLSQVEDPEIPVISIVDLGIVRDVRWQDDGGDGSDGEGGEWVVTITPTYSGCPATHVIAQSVRERLAERGLQRVRLENRIAPAWTTDWISDEASGSCATTASRRRSGSRRSSRSGSPTSVAVREPHNRGGSSARSAERPT